MNESRGCKQISRLLARQMCVALILFSVAVLSIATNGQDLPPNLNSESESETGFRVETVSVGGGAEIVTIFATPRPDQTRSGPVTDLPLVSVLRDTLGDDKPENDRLRYLWMLTYTEPSFRQKVAGYIPFVYSRTRNKTKIGTDPPPSVIDLASADSTMWNSVFWMIFKKITLSDMGIGVRAFSLQHSQNANDYRRSAIAAAVTVLGLYQDSTGEKVLSEREMKDIQARLLLRDKTFGWYMQSENLGRVFDKELAKTRYYRGHNWELLRQYTEAQGLFFDPIEMSDGSARHAIVWASASDIQANKGKKFDKRFLNIRSPWGDEKLLNWKGHLEVRWYDSEDREVPGETEGAHPRTLIPLAIYGLDHPKVPMILVDFRDNGNPKFREISKRVLNDLTGNVLSVSQFTGMPFFIGRYIYDFVTGRRGMDINQASRLRAYSQLKLLLALDSSLDPEFRGEIARRVESSTLNPMQNDADIEMEIARTQYENLIAWAKRDDGLPRRIANDRREEMSRLKHGKAKRTLFAIGSFFTFGRYRHRENATPELMAQLDTRRQLDYHERFLRELAFRSADPRVDSEAGEFRRSLIFLSQFGADAGDKTTRALAKIFSISSESDVQSLCLAGLYRINSSAAKKEMLAIYENDKVDERWRDTTARYLKLALAEGQRISKSDAQVISSISAN